MSRFDNVMPSEIPDEARGGKLTAISVPMDEAEAFQKELSTKGPDDVSDLLGTNFRITDDSVANPIDPDELAPPERLLALAESITTPEDYANKRDDMLAIIDEQIKVTDYATTAFAEHPAMDVLLPLTQGTYDAVLGALPQGLRKDPEFMKTLYNLPSAVYADNPDAPFMYAGLMSRLDDTGRSALDGHFNNILDVLKNKRELTDPYTDAYRAYVVESQSEIAMWQLLNAYETIFNPK